jgi:HSP20 family protein
MRNRPLVPSLVRELEEMQNFWESFDLGAFPSFGKGESSGLSVYEDDKKIYVEAAVPGIKAEDIDIHFEKGTLWIKGETKDEKREKEGVKYHVKASESFSYRISLPAKLDEVREPEAVCKDGILKITFNKSERESPKKIQIKAQS